MSKNFDLIEKKITAAEHRKAGLGITSLPCETCKWCAAGCWILLKGLDVGIKQGGWCKSSHSDICFSNNFSLWEANKEESDENE